MEFTRIKNDVNGNPRYVVHFSALSKDEDVPKDITNVDGSITNVCHYLHGISKVEYAYKMALKRAKSIGGKKFHNKQYGGGIVFQSYSLPELEKNIIEARG